MYLVQIWRARVAEPLLVGYQDLALRQRQAEWLDLFEEDVEVVRVIARQLRRLVADVREKRAMGNVDRDGPSRRAKDVSQEFGRTLKPGLVLASLDVDVKQTTPGPASGKRACRNALAESDLHAGVKIRRAEKRGALHPDEPLHALSDLAALADVPHRRLD